jgi:type I restriction enzyme M protein
VNGVEQFVEVKAQNRLSEANVSTLVKAFHEYADVDRLARVVPMAEIAARPQP